MCARGLLVDDCVHVRGCLCVYFYDCLCVCMCVLVWLCVCSRGLLVDVGVCICSKVCKCVLEVC